MTERPELISSRQMHAVYPVASHIHRASADTWLKRQADNGSGLRRACRKRGFGSTKASRNPVREDLRHKTYFCIAFSNMRFQLA